MPALEWKTDNQNSNTYVLFDFDFDWQDTAHNDVVFFFLKMYLILKT